MSLKFVHDILNFDKKGRNFESFELKHFNINVDIMNDERN